MATTFVFLSISLRFLSPFGRLFGVQNGPQKKIAEAFFPSKFDVGAQEAPRGHQEGLKRSQEAPKTLPSGSQEAPSGSQEVPKAPQVAPKRPQEAFISRGDLPLWLKGALGAPKEAPRQPKRVQKGTRDNGYAARGLSNGGSGPPQSILAS